MTNKVIIDYTKCKYYQKGECEAEIDYNGNYCDYTCESDVMNDCYYRQLQRANSLINDIWNITFHKKPKKLSQKVAIDEILYIHNLTEKALED